MLHQSIRVKDIPTDPKWKAVTDGETMLVHIVMPKAEESAATAAAEGEAAAPAAAAAAPAEPEVIKKGKTEKEEEAPKK
jgi:large subunit ribosomal protein L25